MPFPLRRLDVRYPKVLWHSRKLSSSVTCVSGLLSRRMVVVTTTAPGSVSSSVEASWILSWVEHRVGVRAMSGGEGLIAPGPLEKAPRRSGESLEDLGPRLEVSGDLGLCVPALSLDVIH